MERRSFKYVVTKKCYIRVTLTERGLYVHYRNYSVDRKIRFTGIIRKWQDEFKIHYCKAPGETGHIDKSDAYYSVASWMISKLDERIVDDLFDELFANSPKFWSYFVLLISYGLTFSVTRS